MLRKSVSVMIIKVCVTKSVVNANFLVCGAVALLESKFLANVSVSAIIVCDLNIVALKSGALESVVPTSFMENTHTLNTIPPEVPGGNPDVRPGSNFKLSTRFFAVAMRALEKLHRLFV